MLQHVSADRSFTIKRQDKKSINEGVKKKIQFYNETAEFYFPKTVLAYLTPRLQ